MENGLKVSGMEAIMDFLDKLNDVITSTGQDVAKKARDLADITSLNSQIKACNDNIDRLYREIGKQYFNEYKDKESDELYLEKIQLIQSDFGRINDLSDEIARIKGNVKCKSCKAYVDAKAVFCPSCGEKLESMPIDPQSDYNEVESVKRVCPECNKELEAESTFCIYCGAKLGEAVDS